MKSDLAAWPFSVAGLTFSETSLEIDEGALDFEEWQKLVSWLQYVETGVRWWLGDALAYGDAWFGDESVQAVSEAHDLKVEDVLDSFRVSNKVPPDVRVPGLSWYHHRAVAALPPQQQRTVLKKASTQNLTEKDVRFEVRKIKSQRDLPTAPTEAASYRLFNDDLSMLPSLLDGEKVDVVVTDPPYKDEALSLYTSLSAVAAKILKPGGSAFVMVGQMNLPAFVRELESSLTYWWTLAYLTGGPWAKTWTRADLHTQWKPIVWLVNGDRPSLYGWMDDIVTSPNLEVADHEWLESVAGMEDLLSKVAAPGQTVCDPFAGTSTVGAAALRRKCRYVGTDIDEQAVKASAVRLASVG